MTNEPSYPNLGSTDPTTSDRAYALDDTDPTPETAARTGADFDAVLGGVGANDVKDEAVAGAGAVKDAAVANAAEVRDVTVERGEEVAAVAKDELGRVAADAREQFEDVWSQAREQLWSQANAGQQHVAGMLHALASELGEMASRSNQDGPLTALAKQGAERGGALSHWLSEAEPSDVLTEIRRFARRRPFAFLAGSVVAGIVVGRLSRSLASSSQPSGSRLMGAEAGRGVTGTPGGGTR